MGKLFVWLNLFFLLSDLCAAQTIISGQVRDEKDSAVSFATVTEKGTLNIVTADQEGYYHIKVSSGATLIFTAAEHQSKTLLVTATVLDVVLQRDENMQSVIVTALGITRSRNKVPYAAQQISGKEVSQNRSANFAENLSGRIAGLDIRQSHNLGGSTNIILRGYSSITQDNQALIVVDGIPYSNANRNWWYQKSGYGGYDFGSTVADINPDDIRSVTVLKGAAATALYGSRGANGVILVSSKKGRKGLGITVNTGIEWGMIDKSTFPTYQQKYGGAYYPIYEDDSGYFLYRDPADSFNNTGSPNSVLVVPAADDASYGHVFDPSLTVLQWDAFYPGSPTYGQGHPWVTAKNGPLTFFETPITFNNNILIEGGSENSVLKFGYTRISDKGMMPNSQLTKNLFNFSGTLNITGHFSISAVANYTNNAAKGRYGSGFYGVDAIASNFRQWWPMNVDLIDQKNAYFATKKNISWNITDPTNLRPFFWDNVYFVRNESYETDKHNRFFGNVQLNYKLGKYLDIMGRVSLDSWDEIQEERNNVGAALQSYYSRVNLTYRETNFDLLLNFNKDLSSNINLQALMGGNIRKQRTTYLEAETLSGLVVPGLFALSNSRDNPVPPTENDGNLQVNGVFAGATLAWNDQVILDATLRGDASSTLPADHNTYFYPSFSLGYVFSKSLPEWDWLSNGKVRASYAQVGNDAPLYSVYNAYDINPSFGSRLQASVPGIYNNAELRPERTKSFETGMELDFFQNRLGFDLTYYSNRSFDQILPIFVSTATGYDSKYLNGATITNKGFELTVYLNPVQKKNFRWDINLNWSRNRNRVEKLFEGSENIIIARAASTVTVNATVGQPYGTLRGTDFIYTNGQPTVGSDGRYKISNTSNEIIGDINPDWLGGIQNKFRYKDFSFSFLIDFRKGGDLFSDDLYFGMGNGLYPETAALNDLGNPSRASISEGGGVVMPGVKEDGTTNDIRVSNIWGTFGYGFNPHSRFIYDGSYVKLREVILSYSLPAELISKLKLVRGIDFSLIGRNLWIIHKNLPYSDPEEIFGSGNIQGYQSGAFPSLRRFAFNMRFSF